MSRPREHGRRKKLTLESGIVDLDFTFHSGAAEDGTFPDLVVDGYGVVDAYGLSDGSSVSATVHSDGGIEGPGVLAVLRISGGRYKVVLSRPYRFLLAHSISFVLASSKVVVGLIEAPGLYSEAQFDGSNKAVFHIQLLNASGNPIDLTYEEYVSVKLSLKLSGVV